MGRLIGSAAVLLVLGLPSVAAAEMRARYVGPVPSGVVSADDRYLASSDRIPGLDGLTTSGPVTVRDLATGGSLSVPTPPGCRFAAVGGEALLWTCAGRGYADNGFVHDIRTGERRAYVPLVPQYGVGENARFVAVGKRWLRVERFGIDRSRRDEFIDRATGASRFAGEVAHDRKLHVDLDRPRLVRRLCGGVARPLVPWLWGGSPAVGPGPIALHGRTAGVTMHRDVRGFPARVVLRRCGKPMRRLSDCRRVTCSQPVLDARHVAWTETTRATPSRTRVRVHDIRAKRTRTVALPATSRSSPGIWLVRKRLWATNGERLYRVVGFR